jgi:serine/threonine protein kinase
MTEPDKKDAYIIGQGTYGCVYKPEVSCVDETSENKKYISKVQPDDKTSKHEVEMGKLIKQIPKYDFRYGPIITSCGLNYAKITETELSACKMYVRRKRRKKDTKFISSRLKFLGKFTLDKYLNSVLMKKGVSSEQNAGQYCKIVAETHLYLLESVSIMNATGVLHMDFKSNNIMYEGEGNDPIIIDFGLSYETRKLEMTEYKENAKSPFGVEIDSYIPWCIEIILLSYVARQIGTKKTYSVSEELLRTPITDIKPMEALCNSHIDKMMLIDANEKTQSKTDLKKWVSEFKGKTWLDAWKELTKTSQSWDNYGLSMTYLLELNVSGLIKCDTATIKDKNFLYQYNEELKNVILSEPSKRPLPLETRGRIDEIFRRTSGKVYNEIITNFAQKVKSEDGRKRMATERLQTERTSVRQERQIRMLRNN